MGFNSGFKGLNNLNDLVLNVLRCIKKWKSQSTHSEVKLLRVNVPYSRSDCIILEKDLQLFIVYELDGHMAGTEKSYLLGGIDTDSLVIQAAV